MVFYYPQNPSSTRRLWLTCPARVDPIPLTKMAVVQPLPGNPVFPTDLSHLLISNSSFFPLTVGGCFLPVLVDKSIRLNGHFRLETRLLVEHTLRPYVKVQFSKVLVRGYSTATLVTKIKIARIFNKQNILKENAVLNGAKKEHVYFCPTFYYIFNKIK